MAARPLQTPGRLADATRVNVDCHQGRGAAVPDGQGLTTGRSSHLQHPVARPRAQSLDHGRRCGILDHRLLGNPALRVDEGTWDRSGNRAERWRIARPHAEADRRVLMGSLGERQSLIPPPGAPQVVHDPAGQAEHRGRIGGWVGFTAPL